MSSQILHYNGVELRDCQTLKFMEVPVLNSDKTITGVKRTLRVLGYFSGQPTALFPQMSDQSADADQSLGAYRRRGASQHYNYLKEFLSTPRRTLKFWTDAVPFQDPNGVGEGGFPAGAPAGIKSAFLLHDVVPVSSIRDQHDLTKIDPRNDIAGGPTPISVDVTHLASNEVWRVEFEIEWTVAAFCPQLENGATTLNPNVAVQLQFRTSNDDTEYGILPKTEELSVARSYGVRSHTWTCTEDINSDFFTTRTYNGELKLSNPNFNPLDFRYLCRPPLVVGARRKSINYRTSEDKLTLQYTIIDEEVMVAAPNRYTGLAIKHSESAVDFGAIVNVSLDVSLRGDRFANRFDMMAYIIAIIDYKLHIRDQNAGGDGFRFLSDSVEITTAEGTDQDVVVLVRVRGTRNIDANKGLNAGNNVNANNVVFFGFLNDRQITRLPNTTFAAVPNAPPYDHSLSRGINNDGTGTTKPDVAGGLVLGAAWHAYITEPCSDRFSFIDVSDWTTNDAVRRAELVEQIQDASEDEWNQIPVSFESPDTPLLPFFTLAGISASHEAALYTVYNIQSHYHNNTMSVALPSSKSTSTNIYVTTPATSFVRIGPDQWRRQINITAERYGLPPRIPTMDDTYTEAKLNAATSQDVVNAKLLRASVSPCAPKLAVHSAGRIYSIDAEYLYALDAEPANLKLGIPDIESLVSSTLPSEVPAFTVAKSDVLSSSTWGVEV